MSYTTTIPAGKVSETELIALVEQINILTKSKLSVEKKFVITTDDVHLSSMLDSLVDALPTDQPAVAKKNGKAILTDMQKLTGIKPPRALVKQAAQWDAEITTVAKGVAVETAQAKK